MKAAFEGNLLTLTAEQLLPTRKLTTMQRRGRKYQQVLASLEEVGLIEPLMVRATDGGDQYLLLDGHVRLAAMAELGWKEICCLQARDDDIYLYNTRVNRLTPIQEHRMLARAVERGVDPERLARALKVDVASLHRKLRLLDGICPEAVALLQDRSFGTNVPKYLRKMKPLRQIEAVELMVAANQLTEGYARALLVATPAAQLQQGDKPKKVGNLTAEQMQQMEDEMGKVQERYRLIEQTYGDDLLNLTLVQGYLAKLLKNEAVLRYLNNRHGDLVPELQAVVAAGRTES